MTFDCIPITIIAIYSCLFGLSSVIGVMRESWMTYQTRFGIDASYTPSNNTFIISTIQGPARLSAFNHLLNHDWRHPLCCHGNIVVILRLSLLSRPHTVNY
jgi:hypothetical protein